MQDERPRSVRAQTSGHIPVLDGIRGIAVLMVINFHFWRGYSRIAHTWLGKVVVYGQTGVDLFFVLSGFLITMILLDSKGSDHFLRNFYVRRILRIFPLYYATLCVVFVILPLVHATAWTPWQISTWYWAYLQNIPATFWPKLTGGPGHLWSLAVEEHYYLIWPMLVMSFTRDRLLKIIVFAIVLSIVTRLLLIHYSTFYFTLSRLDGLAIGSAIGIFAREQAGLRRFVRSAWILFLLIVPLLVVSQFFVSGRGLAAVEVFKSTLIAVTYACIIVLAVEDRLGRSLKRVLGSRALGSVGKYSYAMYVLHPFVISSVFRRGIGHNAAGLLISAVGIYLAAWLSWTILESRFLRLKRHFEYRTSVQSSSAALAVSG